ncbi:unnamed protein product, partial [Soboliphyme baturini]|uniref:Uncharacterized protein n=1 Tax=Soboliphyme baturini TaxID=241478 RepID=A0A183ISN7_9BILA
MWVNFGKRTGTINRRLNDCIVLEPSEMIVVDYPDVAVESRARKAVSSLILDHAFMSRPSSSTHILCLPPMEAVPSGLMPLVNDGLPFSRRYQGSEPNNSRSLPHADLLLSKSYPCEKDPPPRLSSSYSTGVD